MLSASAAGHALCSPQGDARLSILPRLALTASGRASTCSLHACLAIRMQQCGLQGHDGYGLEHQQPHIPPPRPPPEDPPAPPPPAYPRAQELQPPAAPPPPLLQNHVDAPTQVPCLWDCLHLRLAGCSLYVSIPTTAGSGRVSGAWTACCVCVILSEQALLMPSGSTDGGLRSRASPAMRGD